MGCRINGLSHEGTYIHKANATQWGQSPYELALNFLNARLIQLNEYETAPYLIQFSQKLTCDCLLISVFCPEFT